MAAIPYGKVTTYGEVARLAGSPRAARQVGGVLRRLPEGSTLPRHRVINRHGRISQQGGFSTAAAGIAGGGGLFSAHSTVDFDPYAGAGKKQPLAEAQRRFHLLYRSNYCMAVGAA